MRMTEPFIYRATRARRVALAALALLGFAPFGDVFLRTALANSPDDVSAGAPRADTVSVYIGDTDATHIPEDAHDCLVEPHVTADVGSPVQGIIARLLVERGETVVHGQPVAELDAGVERATLEQAEARADMHSEVASREADLALARLDKRRFSDLHARRLASEQQSDEASARYLVASAALVQALENRKLHYLELQRARSLLEQRTVRSPVDGVVVHHHLVPGELVYDEPIMTIAGLDPLRIEVVLPARLFGTVRRGDEGRVFLELDEGTEVSATVEVIDPLLDTRSGTFGVRLRLPNPGRAIVAGQKCRVAFVPGPLGRADAVDVPIAAAVPAPDEGASVIGDSARDTPVDVER